MNIRGLVTTVTSKFGVTCLNGISIILLAHSFGSIGIALFALLRTVPLVFSILFEFGLSHSYSYLINVKRFDKYEVLSSQISLALVLALLQIFLWLAIDGLISELFNFTVNLNDFTIIALVAPSIVLQLHLIGYSRAVGNIKYANFISLYTELVITLFVVSIIYIKLEISGIVYTIAIPYFLVSLLLLVKSLVSKQFKLCLPKKDIIKQAFSFGIKSQLGNACQILNYRLDQLVVSFFLGPHLLGLYVVAVKVAEVFRVFSLSIVFVFEPELSKLQAKDALNYIKRYFWKIFSLNFLLVAFGAVLAPYIIPFLFDSWSKETITPFYIICIGIIIAGGNSFLAAYFLGHGKPIITTYSIAIALIITFLSNLVLVPIYGLQGAAIGTSMGYLTVSIVLFYFMHNEKKLFAKESV